MNPFVPTWFAAKPFRGRMDPVGLGFLREESVTLAGVAVLCLLSRHETKLRSTAGHSL
jgi:hypothetical protein